MEITWFIPPNQINRYIPDSISKVLRLGYYNYDHVSASVWLRCLQLIPYLEEKGIRCRINDFSAESDIAILNNNKIQQNGATLGNKSAIFLAKFLAKIH